ncbi:MAG TPA: HEAT repeat domain-containing protein [Dongiaceae bacterium]|nr:HEAT repeat domain-containing protein [Dongiaceae bacterium]
MARAIAIAEDERRFAPELSRFLTDPRAAVRARAVLAVGRLQDTTTVAALIPLAEDTSVVVRREVLFALGQIGHRSARAVLERHLAESDNECALLAVEALGKLGDPAATAAVISQLGAPEPRRRGEAAVALWRLADSTALGALLARHRDPDPSVRWRVIYALEKIHAPERIVLPVASHLSDDDARVRAYAARTLGRQKTPRATAYLLQALGDADPAVRINAMRAITFSGDSTCARCARALAGQLAYPHPYVRVTAAVALGAAPVLAGADSAGRSMALDSLRSHLADPDAATRGACAVALLTQLHAAAWPRVAPLLEDTSVVTRVAVIGGLGALSGEEAESLLVPRLKGAHALIERMTAADELGTLKRHAALHALYAGLADSSALVAASCAGAIQEIGDSASVPRLTAAYVGRSRERPTDARDAIRDALRALAGRPYADSIEKRFAPHRPAPVYPADFAEPSSARGAILHTTKGDIEWAFDRDLAVETVKNFVTLAERGFFDGNVVHRVVPNFVIQDGDPTGTGGGGPGYTIRCEYNQLRYEAGMVGMALSGKATGGSQWFITHSPQPHLNGRYTIFAHVVRGMDVVWNIVPGDRITKIEILR